MKRMMIAFLLFALPGIASAAVGAPLDKAPVDLKDQASLQRGAAMFANYCSGCHGLSYMRYTHVGRDLGLSDDQLRETLIFTRDAAGAQTKVGDLMKSAIPPKDAAEWFGVAPPDLTVIARSRGADWLYTFFRSYHIDETRPLGVNNATFPSVGMPHVLWELEGLKRRVDDGKGAPKFEMVSAGKLDPVEYDAAVADLVNYLVYMGDPMQNKRQQLGLWVLLFLAVFTIMAYLLKKEYWRDIH